MATEDNSIARKTRLWIRPRGLWQHSDFLRLWGALSVSLTGSEITLLALPLLAVTTLGASAGQMGILVAAGTLPFLLCSLPGGVWIDRNVRRPILITTDVLRAAFLLSIPVAALLDVITMTQLYIVAFTVGVLSVLFEIAHYAYVPSLVGRRHVLDANSKMQISYSASESLGPGVAGALVQIASAPAAILINAVTFLASAELLRRIRSPEPAPVRARDRSLRGDIRDGLAALLGHPLLRPIVLTSITDSIFRSAIMAMYVLYVVSDLGVSPLTLGVIFAAGGVGAIPGAMLSTRAAARFGMGPAMLGAWFFGAATLLLIPLASGQLASVILSTGMLLGGLAHTVANIQQWSLRQIVTPDDLQGRVTASHRFLVYGALPVGALLGGTLGSIIGLWETILLCAFGVIAAPLWALFSPLRELREPPTIDGASRNR